MAEEENVRVAVRVRPFNSREKARNAKLIVEMVGNSTKIQNPEVSLLIYKVLSKELRRKRLYCKQLIV